MSSVSPKLSRLVRDVGEAVIARLEGEFSTETFQTEVVKELKKCDFKAPEILADLARTLVRSELAERANHDPFVEDDKGQLRLDMFDQAMFAHGVIRLGNSFNVKMIDATGRQWLVRQLHQQQAAQAAQQAAMKTTMFLQTPPGVLLMEHPTLTTVEAMRQAELWPEEPNPEPTLDQPQAGA